MRKILFDFDGTLMDTWPGIRTTLRASFQALDLPLKDDQLTSALVGMPLTKVFEKLLGGDEAASGAAARKYRELFPSTGMQEATPYEGVAGMLEGLKTRKFELFLVTARNETITKQMVARQGLTGFFTWVRGEQEGEHPEGKHHMIAEVVERFGLIPSECVMVGDRRYDMEAAVNNSIGAIGVTYGYGTAKELLEAGAERLAGSIRELVGILSHKD